MQYDHPFAVLAPVLALMAFAATGVAGLAQGVPALPLVGRTVFAFFVVFYLARACARLLAALPAPPPETKPDPAEGEK